MYTTVPVSTIFYFIVWYDRDTIGRFLWFLNLLCTKFSDLLGQQKTYAGSCGSEVCLFWCVAHLELPYYTCSLHLTIRKWFNESTRSYVI